MRASLVVVVINSNKAVKVLTTSSTKATFCLLAWAGMYFFDTRGCKEYCKANNSMHMAAMGERLLFLAAAEYTMVVPPNKTAGPTESFMSDYKQASEGTLQYVPAMDKESLTDPCPRSDSSLQDDVSVDDKRAVEMRCCACRESIKTRLLSEVDTAVFPLLGVSSGTMVLYTANEVCLAANTLGPQSTSKRSRSFAKNDVTHVPTRNVNGIYQSLLGAKIR